MPLILEGIVTTLNDDGTLNVSPMGPIVDESLTSFTFRPFRTSRTYQNLRRDRCGVFHVVDDVLLIARAVTGTLDEPASHPAEKITGRVLDDCCRWVEFEVETLDDSAERTTISVRVVHRGTRGEFFGFNRARHAVLEAAILATRLFLLPRDEVRAELSRLAVIVEKTAGPREREAFDVLRAFVDRYHADDDSHRASDPG